MIKTHGNILNLQLDLPERLFLVIVKIGERELDNTTLEGVVGVLCDVSSVSAVSKIVTEKFERSMKLDTHSNPGIG